MLTTRKPFEGITPFRTWVDEMFENLGPFAKMQREGLVERPRFAVEEETERYVVTAELPGIKPEEVAVELDGNVIKVSYRHEEKGEEAEKTYHRIGAFERTFTLPENVAADAINAKMVDGFLTICLPKTEGTKRLTIPVEVAVGTTAEKTAPTEGKATKAA
jgi:HSP20 family protein